MTTTTRKRATKVAAPKAKALPRLPSRHDLEHDAAFRKRLAASRTCAPGVPAPRRRPVPIPDPARTADGLRAAAGLPPHPLHSDIALVCAQPLLTPGQPLPHRERGRVAIEPAIRWPPDYPTAAELMATTSTRGPSGAPGGASW